MATDQIKTEVMGAIGWLTFNNLGRHNAIGLDMAEAVPEVIDGFESQ